MALGVKKPYKVLVFRSLGGLGDMLMSTPVYRGLKEKYPGCKVTVATTWVYGAGALPELLRNNEMIDEVVRIEPFEFCPPMTKSNKLEYANVPNDRIPACVQEADEVIELNVICAITETKEMHEPGGVRTHRTDIWCRHAQVEPSCRKPILRLTKDELREGKDWCDQHLGQGKRIGVVLRTMSPQRNWPYTIEFIRMLKQKGYRVATLDSTNQMDDDTPAVVGKKIRPVASIIAHLDAVVTPDTGLLHVAGALGTPLLAIFGSTHGEVRMREYAGSYTQPEKFAPCAPCFYKYGCLMDRDQSKHMLCFKRIRPELVEHELQRLLERYAPAVERQLACAAA